MRLVYVGPHDAVEIYPTGGEEPMVTAQRDGDPIEVPDEMAANLLEQGTFRKATKKDGD